MPIREPDSRLKRIMMQAAMWVVLGATVALAALVTQHQRSKYLVELGAVESFGNLDVQLPKDWQNSAGHPPVIARCVERKDAKKTGRILTISIDRVRTLMSPAEYLHPNAAADPDKFEPVSFDGHPGVMTVLKTELPPELIELGYAERFGQLTSVVAATILPSRQVIFIKLERIRRLEESDLELVKDVIASIKLKDVRQLDASSSTLTLPGISMSKPADFAVISTKDPLRDSIELVSTNPEQWSSVEVISCHLRNPDAGAIKSLLSVHDPIWLSAGVQQVGAGEWQVDAAEPRRGYAYASRAFIKTNDDGTALVMVGRSGSSSADSLTRAWKSVLPTISFKPARDWPTLIEAGQATTQRIRSAGLDELLRHSRKDLWLLWSKEDPAGFTGFSYYDFQDNSDWAMTAKASWEAPDRTINRSTQKWETDSAGTNYTYELQLVSASLHKEQRGNRALDQRSRYSKSSKLSTSIASASAPLGSESFTVPADFIPGAWMPALLPLLGDAPQIITTDSFPGLEGRVCTRPIEILIERTTDTPRNDDRTEKPLRCITVRIIALGQSQHWYFDDQNNLKHISLPNSEHREPSTKQQIEFNLNNDSRLNP